MTGGLALQAVPLLTFPRCTGSTRQPALLPAGAAGSARPTAFPVPPPAMPSTPSRRYPAPTNLPAFACTCRPGGGHSSLPLLFSWFEGAAGDCGRLAGRAGRSACYHHAYQHLLPTTSIPSPLHTAILGLPRGTAMLRLARACAGCRGHWPARLLSCCLGRTFTAPATSQAALPSRGLRTHRLCAGNVAVALFARAAHCCLPTPALPTTTCHHHRAHLLFVNGRTFRARVTHSIAARP